MRIDKHKYQSLKLLKDQNWKWLNYYKTINTERSDFIKRIIFNCGMKADYCTKKIQDIIFNGESRLESVYDNIEDSNGCVIIQETVIYYSIEKKEGHIYVNIVSFVENSLGEIRSVVKEVGKKEIDTIGDVDYCFFDDMPFFKTHPNRIPYYFFPKIVLCYEAFKQLAEIEIKLLPRNSGIDLHHCHYINNSDVSIQLIDSAWYTTLIQSEGFSVRGHFRLQPYGEGLKQRKLIWIDEFQKNGYTREAGKIKEF